MKINRYSKNAILLADRIKRETGYEVEPIINRTRAGCWQRATGAWRWHMLIKTNNSAIGSQERAIDCLKAKKWSISKHFQDTCIDIIKS